MSSNETDISVPATDDVDEPEESAATQLLDNLNNTTKTAQIIPIKSSEKHPYQSISIARKPSAKKDETVILAAAIGSIQTLKSISPKRVQARTVLWYLVFTGFAVNYMIRLTVNIAIVEMIAQKPLNHQKVFVSECLLPQIPNAAMLNHSSILFDKLISENGTTNHSLLSAKDDHQIVISKPLRYSIEKHLLQIDYDRHGFDWNENEQGRVLGSYYWLHWILQVPGGILGRRYGSKLIFGFANFFGAFLGFLMPIGAYYHVNYLIVLRVLQGMVTGLAWPAMNSMTAQWIPPNERSKFVTSYLGSSIGTAVFYPIFGIILAHMSWEWVYHLSAILGTMWFIAWCYFAYDTPAKHPRIDPVERAYIESAIGETFQSNKKDKTPWVSILKSRAVWIIIIAQWGGVWGLSTLLTQGPTYFQVIHGWTVQMAGILCGLPHMARVTFAYFFSTFGDSLLKSERMTRTNVRRMAGGICNVVNGLFVVALAFSGCNATASIVFLTFATGVQGGISTGPLANIIDISPNYSGVVLGICSLISSLPGIISPYIVGKLTVGNQTVQQWQYVFLLVAAMLIGCGSIYICFADATLQYWNSPQQREEVAGDKEMQPLQTNVSAAVTEEQNKNKQNNDCDTIKS